jgi:uncharacterized membrane protein required for colicin V production
MIDFLENNATLVFDIGALLVVLIFVIVNAVRGFSKTYISVIGYVIAIIIGGIAGDGVSGIVYNNVLQGQNVQNVQDVLEDTDVPSAVIERIKSETYGVSLSETTLEKASTSADSMYRAINTGDSELFSSDKIREFITDSVDGEVSYTMKSIIPNSAVDYMLNTMRSSDEGLYSTLPSLLKTDKDSAEYIEETFVKPVVVYIINMAIFLILFFIVMVIVKIVSKHIENNTAGIVAVSTTDRVLGGIFGIVEAFVILLLAVVVIKWQVFVHVDTSQILNDSVIQSTKLFKYIYNIDTIKLIV